MASFSVLAGTLLILVALREMLHQFFHPQGQGTLCEWTMRFIFRVFRARLLRGHLSLAGPLGVASSIAIWAALLALGWSLVYAPFLPVQFAFDAGLPDEKKEGFTTALYLSIVTLGTLGYGDIAPTATALRLLAPLEALMGFGLLSAGVTWVNSLYPAVARQRSFAHEVHVLAENDMASTAALSRLGEAAAVSLLEQLADKVVTTRADLTLFSALRYFHMEEPRSSLPSVSPYLLRIARAADDPHLPEPVRMRASILQSALQDFAETVSTTVIHEKNLDTAEVFVAFARQHHGPAR